MSIRTDALNDAVSRTANLPASNAFSMCGWSYIVSDLAGVFQGISSLRQSDSVYLGLFWDYDNNTMCLDASGNVANFASRPAAGTWFFWAMSNSGTGAGSFDGYWSAASSSTVVTATRAGAAITPGAAVVGYGAAPSDRCDARHQYVKCWDAVLTQAEFEAEKWSARPRRFANLNFFWPLRNAAETQDWGPLSRNATVGGTLATEDGPPVTWAGVPVGFRTFSADAAGNDIVAAGSLSVTGAAVLNATGTLVAAGSASITGSADFDAIGQIVAAGSLSVSGAADLDAIGSLVAAGSLSITGTAEIAGSLNDVAAVGSLSITGAASLTALGQLVASGTIVVTGVAELTGEAAAATPAANSGGWEFFARFEREQQRRRRKRREIEEREEETQRIQDATDREIAQLLRKQEALDERRAELERLAALVNKHADRAAQDAYGERVAQALARAHAQATFGALMALEREIERAQDEEEFVVMAILQIEAD